jgi:hypothetical protein
MREIRPSGSVRGANRKVRPYRDIPNPMRSSAYFDSVGTEARGGLQGRSEQGLRRQPEDVTGAASETPRTTECDAASPPQTQQSRPRGRPARHAADGSEMGGRIGGRLGGVKREDGEASGGDGRER